MQSVLSIRAGKRALERMRSDGLQPSDIEIVPGAAGGPKALGILGLDRAVFGEWLATAPGVRHLIGSSIGAWRFACACRADPLAALDAFAQAYTQQTYPRRPSRRLVTDSAREMLRGLFQGNEDEVLAHPHYRLHILTVRGRWPLTRDSAFHTPIGFGAAAMANVLGRRHLARFLERTIFHDPREHPVFFRTGSRFDAFNTHEVALGKGNLGDALLASASIPMVLEGVADIPSAPRGTYWDGGLIDYHIHLPYHRTGGLVLYPHFTDRIVPGWLDKGMPWRHARGEWLDNVVLVAPSREYLAGLPHGKLPDRRDFARFSGDDAGRMKYWRQAIGESARLGDAFLEFARAPGSARVAPL